MTEADARAADALLAAGGRSAPHAGESAPDPADGQSGGNPTKSVAPRRNGLLCDACNQAIERCGYSFVNVHAAWVRAQRYDEWRRHRIRYGWVTNPPPERVSWQLVHPWCHVDPDYPRLFVIGVERLRTDRQLLEWALTLSRQKWGPHTAYEAMIRTVLDAR